MATHRSVRSRAGLGVWDRSGSRRLGVAPAGAGSTVSAPCRGRSRPLPRVRAALAQHRYGKESSAKAHRKKIELADKLHRAPLLHGPAKQRVLPSAPTCSRSVRLGGTPATRSGCCQNASQIATRRWVFYQRVEFLVCRVRPLRWATGSCRFALARAAASGGSGERRVGRTRSAVNGPTWAGSQRQCGRPGGQ